MAKTIPILDGAYEVIGVIPGEIGYQGGKVDLSKISAAKAEQLVQDGFPYLRRTKAKAPRKRAAKAKEKL